MIYRNPRDIAISFSRWYTYSKNFPRTVATKEQHRFMNENFSNDEERLTHVTKQEKGNYSGILAYAPWLRSPNCLAVKFEDLYQDVVSLKDGAVGGVLRQVVDYVEIDERTIDPLDFYDTIHGKSFTASSEEQKIGQYKRVFTEDQHALFDNPEFRNVLEAFGYEW